MKKHLLLLLGVTFLLMPLACKHKPDHVVGDCTVSYSCVESYCIFNRIEAHYLDAIPDDYVHMPHYLNCIAIVCAGADSPVYNIFFLGDKKSEGAKMHRMIAEEYNDTSYNRSFCEPAQNAAIANRFNSLVCYKIDRNGVETDISDKLTYIAKSFIPFIENGYKEESNAKQKYDTFKSFEIKKVLSKITSKDLALIDCHGYYGGHILLQPIAPYKLEGQYKVVLKEYDRATKKEKTHEMLVKISK